MTKRNTNSTRVIDCLSMFAFSSTLFFGAFFGLTIHPTAKVSEQKNGNLPATNTLVQLLSPYTDPESHDVRRHGNDGIRIDRPTGNGQTDYRMTPITDHTV